MPFYTFKNSTTGETWEDFMSISSMQEVLANNPDVSTIIYAPSIVSGVMGITHKVSGSMNEVLAKAAEAHPNSPLADKVGGRGVKEVKTREVYNKHK